MADWSAFQSGLAQALAQVTDRVYLIIASEADPTRYVQFAGDPAALYAEAPDTDVVRDADVSVLADAGWTAPVPAQPNWTSPLARPALTAEYAALAERNVIALRDAYGVSSPDDLAYRAWREPELIPPGETWSPDQIADLDPGADSIDFSILGISSD